MAAVQVAEPLLELSGLTKRYGSTLALDGLDMAVEAGHVVGLLGPNGAGKTTAVKILLGLVHPTGGHGRLFGRPLGDPRARRQVGYLPELFRFQGWLTGREVLQLHLELAGIDRERWQAEVGGALAMADLAARADDRVATYSKGMQQRLGLAAALLGSPRLVVLDEPGTALDPIGRHELRDTIRGLAANGAAVMLNSHQLSEVEQVCDRVVILHRGRLQVAGPLAELLSAGGIRVRATGIGADLRARLAELGPLSEEGPWLHMSGAAEAQVPAVVDLLAAHGARVYGVELLQPTLEERFIQLLQGGAG